MHDQRKMHDQTRAHDHPPHPRKTSLLPLLAALALLPLTAGAEAPRVETSGVETSGVDTAPWVPDECCELAAASAVHNPLEGFMPVTPDKENKEPPATSDAIARPGFPAQPAVALMLVGMGGFIARSRRLR